MSLLLDPTELLLRMVSEYSSIELIIVPVLSCPLAAGLRSLLESPHLQLWCTGPAAPAHCASWSHTRWTLAGSHRAVASVQCTPPGRGQRRDKTRHSVLICCMCHSERDQNKRSLTNTSTMGVCSGRTKGTKITESSCESLTMNIRPRLNIQVAAAC